MLVFCYINCYGLTLAIGLFLNNRIKKTDWFRSAIPDINNYPTNDWYREHYTRNYDIVNIGSSSAKCAFNYSDLGIKAFNWAEQPQSLTYGYKVLKTYFSILKNNGIVVISLGPFSGLDVDLKWAKDRNDKYYYILAPNLIFDYRRVAFRRRYPLFAYPIKSLKVIVKGLLCRSINNNDIDGNSNIFVDDADKWLDEWLEEFNIKDIDAPLSDDNKASQSIRISLLSDIITFCLQRNLRPVIVSPPMHPSLALKFSNTFRENYIYSFVRKANSAKIPFYNYMDDPRFSSDSYFKNAFLLNDVGAKHFTNILLKELNLI